MWCGIGLQAAVMMTMLSRGAASAGEPSPLDDAMVASSLRKDAQAAYLRVVCWNVARGARLEDIIGFLRRADADIILLQEVDLNCKRTRRRDVTAELAHALGLYADFGIEFQELGQGSRSLPAYHGQATLSKRPIRCSRVLGFNNQSDFWQPRWFLPNTSFMQRRLGGRIALVSEIDLDGATIVAYNVHLESRGSLSLRIRQLEELFCDMRRYPIHQPMILAGDFNTEKTRPAAAGLLRKNGFRDATADSGPTGRQNRVIDWITVRGALAPVRGLVVRDVAASDHYPLVADLLLHTARAEENSTGR